MLAEYAGTTEWKESAYSVTNATLNSSYQPESCSDNTFAYLTVNNSRQKRALINGLERGPNAFRPISEYDRSLGSSRTMRARILALMSRYSVPGGEEIDTRTCNR